MTALTHFEDGNSVYFYANTPPLCAAIIEALQLVETPEDFLEASRLMAENETGFHDKTPEQFLFTNQDCELIVRGLAKYDKGPRSEVVGFAKAVSAFRIERYIAEALGLPWPVAS
ncbi:MAG TPA: hypothetical protein VMQ52_04775 [Candidatus Saccharimonadales bacterium]|jgi:hypothetical protein|nr:hypothetical protein [Candidatus Saccharimonadales bacterium]